MNSIRPQEVLDILELLRAIDSAAGAGGGHTVLATFVTLGGSAYSRSGTMAVFVPTAGLSANGIIPVTELEGALRREIDEVSASGRSRLAALDLAEDDPVLGFGLGAPGRVEVLLEPVDERLREHMSAVREALSRNEGVVCGLEIEGPELGRRVLHRADEPEVRECYLEISPEVVESSVAGRAQRIFLCPVHPMGKAMIFGSGPVAAALCRHLAELGFSVFAADPRPGRLKGPEWGMPRVALIEGGWEQARACALPDPETSIVVLTCSYALDLETLQGALKSPASYVGLTGPRQRTQRLLAELSTLEAQPRPGVFFAPAGLDIGADTPRETALAIAAEILAARSGRRGGRSSSRRGLPQSQ